MHPRARGSADILASAQVAQPPPRKKARKPRRPRQPNPLWSNPNFTNFPQQDSNAPGASSSSSVLDLAATMMENLYKSFDPTAPAKLKFIPQSVPNDPGKNSGRECSLQPDCIAHNMPEIPDILGETMSNEASHTLLSCEQCIEELVQAFRDRDLDPFDLFLVALDDSNPAFSSYRDEFYKADNKQLAQILDLVSSNPAGRNKLDTLLARRSSQTGINLPQNDGQNGYP